jgi:hypothetical protein
MHCFVELSAALLFFQSTLTEMKKTLISILTMLELPLQLLPLVHFSPSLFFLLNGKNKTKLGSRLMYAVVAVGASFIIIGSGLLYYIYRLSKVVIVENIVCDFLLYFFSFFFFHLFNLVLNNTFQ